MIHRRSEAQTYVPRARKYRLHVQSPPVWLTRWRFHRVDLTDTIGWPDWAYPRVCYPEETSVTTQQTVTDW